jgi:hypothetical protein
MSNTIRIRTTPNGNDSYLKVKLDQDFDFIEILSLRLSQEDVYRKFCSDYGAIVGRVIINSGFGVPNAKVSVFIPIDNIDKNDSTIKGLYPFEIITDKNNDGIRYNLFPKESETNNDCFTPIGTFPTKREVLDNDTMMNVYCKYYKFTTTTNHAGDFMIFGVPLGTYTVHVDADISDIGEASQRPYDLIRQGTPVKMFDSPTKFKGGTNLDKLVQVKSANVGVNVQPFWGDTDNCEIGISRVDIDLNYNIVPAAIFMGSIYGDQHKHSVSKRCRPRTAMGELCQQITGPGSIEMIRKTLDGTIESFDVDGGRVIDDDGTWAYQIPMNLDYVVTAEDGSLIPSNDPNIGVPTRASVRFRIGMDETGGEGRLRTRAKYLVPNNPQTPQDIDYNFDTSTKDNSFKDLYWDKIYTVSNFISRYQKSDASPTTRKMIGTKNVDACAGDKNPFPYNRVNTELNPIFFIICLIITIIGFLIYVMNAAIIPAINIAIYLINIVLGLIVAIINTIIDAINVIPGINIDKIPNKSIPYIGCLTVLCPSDDGALFAPGCKNGGLDGGLAFNNSSPAPNYYCGDSFGHTCAIGNTVGLDQCISMQMAESLDLYQFDFYNDWVTGTLFGFLLKYKKKRKGRERFCEYDCSDFVNDPNYSGVDGNNNGIPDNDCHNEKLVDTCIDLSNCGSDCQKSIVEFNPIREGVIKKVNNEFYYAATLHTNTNIKLFATDIICLGSIFDCDWQGFPKLQPYLITTSYKMSPDTQEIGPDSNGNEITYETGLVDIGGTTKGMFFRIDCLGIHSNSTQCLNIRHQCEIFVDIDEIREDPNGVIIGADGTLGSDDIDELGQEVRNSFFALNNSSNSVNTFNLPSTTNTNFNIQNTLAYYDFTSTYNNGNEYIDFRGYNPASDSVYTQPKHSYYMYFGILPGKSALDKMNQRYFTTCNRIVRNDMILQTSAVADITNTSSGSITFTVIGGHGPYTYSVTSPSLTNNGTINANPNNPNESSPITINNLSVATYTINASDINGNTVTANIVVSGPIPFYCSASVTKNVTSASIPDGQITINGVGGGTPPYTYQLQNYLGTIISSGPIATTPYQISNLISDATNGYKIIVNDSASNTCITTGLTISGPSVLVLTANKTDITCYNGNDGKINLTINGGTGPFIYTTTGPAGYSSNSINMSNLSVGTYTTTVIDSYNNTANVTTVLNSLNPQLTIGIPTSSQLSKQCDPLNYNVPIYITAGLSAGQIAYITYQIDGGSLQYTSMTYTNPSTPLIITIPKSSINNKISVKFSNTSTNTCFSNTVTYTTTQMVLPSSNLNFSITTTNTSHTVSSPTGGIGSVTFTPFGVGIHTNTSLTLTTTATDSVGCSVTKTG